MPVMRFDDGSIPFVDDGEHFFPVRVTAITNNTGNRLLQDGNQIAIRNADGTGFNIGYLKALGATYPHTNATVQQDDTIDELASAITKATGK